MGLYGVIHLPAFALQAVLARRADAPEAPAVLVGKVGRQVLVRESNRAARRAGIEAGMTEAQACGRLPGVAVHTAESEAEAAATRVLIAAARSLTPRVEATAPGLVTFDTRGLLERAPETLASRLRLLVRQGGYFPGIGFAVTPDLAALAARFRPPVCVVRDVAAFLKEVPVTMADFPGNVETVLHTWGIRTLGALLRLPRAALVERLGSAVGDHCERLAGQRARPLRIVTDPPRFHEAIEWESPVETLEPLLFILRRFLDQLVLQLQAAARCAGALRLTLRECDGPGHARRFDLPEPTQSAELLFRVLHLHLEQTRLASPLDGFALEIEAVDPPHRQRDLFQAGLKDPWQLSDTLAKLRGLVGEGRVGAPRLEDSHRPDTVSLGPLAEIPSIAAVAEDPAPYGPALRRERPGPRVHVRLREGLPALIETDTERWTVVAALGPYPLSGAWWSPSGAWGHAEWDVELADGRLCRLLHKGAWHLGGFYD